MRVLIENMMEERLPSLLHHFENLRDIIHVGSGEYFSKSVMSGSYDIVVFGNAGPGTLDAIGMLRLSYPLCTIAINGADMSQDDRITSLHQGVDDIIDETRIEEAAIKIRNIAARRYGMNESRIQIGANGDVELRFDSRTVNFKGKDIRLCGREFDVLKVLALRLGQPASRDYIISAIYGGYDAPGGKMIDVLVCNIRKKFMLAGCGPIIATSRRCGYIVDKPGPAKMLEQDTLPRDSSGVKHRALVS